MSDLLRYGQEWRFKETWADSALLEAINENNWIVAYSYVYNIDVNRLLADGRTFLGYAAEKDNLFWVKKLLDNGANPSGPDQFANTPNTYAKQCGNKEIEYILSLAEQPNWDKIRQLEISITMLMNQLDEKNDIHRVLQKPENSHFLKHICGKQNPKTNTLWFCLHDNFRIGYDESNHLHTMIFDREITPN